MMRIRAEIESDGIAPDYDAIRSLLMRHLGESDFSITFVGSDTMEEEDPCDYIMGIEFFNLVMDEVDCPSVSISLSRNDESKSIEFSINDEVTFDQKHLMNLFAELISFCSLKDAVNNLA
jgi:hypothetical protein